MFPLLIESLYSTLLCIHTHIMHVLLRVSSVELVHVFFYEVIFAQCMFESSFYTWFESLRKGFCLCRKNGAQPAQSTFFSII